MNEVTVYKVIEEKQIISSPDRYEYFRVDSEHGQRVFNSDEFVFNTTEKIVLPITKYYLNGNNVMYVAFDKSFDNLMAMYSAAEKDAVDKVIKDAEEYRTKWLKQCSESEKLRCECKITDNKISTFNSLGLFKKLMLVLKGKEL